MASRATIGAKTPSTLLTLPREIRDLIWEYCLVSPTHRVLPVSYSTLPAADPPSPLTWTATRPDPLSPSANDASYAAALRIAFTKTLHLVPCAPATDVPLSRTVLPLAHSLPLVNRQLHAETAGRFWDANTLVLPDYAAGHEVLEYLGPASQGVKRVEMTIGNVWDVGSWQGSQVIMILNQLERLVREGALEILRLKYLVGDEHSHCRSKAFSLWLYMLIENREESDWTGCKRELVLHDDNTDWHWTKHQLDCAWGLVVEEGKLGEFSIRKLGTKSVTLYPTKAQVVRNVNGVSLKPGPNQVTIVGLTPTCDEHSIKVDGTGAATITDLTIELVPNPEVYADIYPDEDESDEDASEESDAETETVTGRLKEIADETAKLRSEVYQQQEIQNNVSKRLSMVDLYLTTQGSNRNPINLSEVIDGYRDERAKIFAEKTSAYERIQEINAKVAELTKEERRLTRESRKAKAKAEKEKAKARQREERKKREKQEEKARIRKERVKFWPKNVFKVTISLEAPSGFTPASSRRSSIDSTVKVPEVTKTDEPIDTAEINLSLSYITYSASWTPRYDLSLNTVTNTGTLDYSAELTNVTSETWRDAKVVLSTSQSSYQGLSDTIPTLQPWHIRLIKGDAHGHNNAALQSNYEINQAQQNRNELPPQVYKPRNELFGIDRNDGGLSKSQFRPQQSRVPNYPSTFNSQPFYAPAAPMTRAMAPAGGFGNALPPPPPSAQGVLSASTKKKQVSRSGFQSEAYRREITDGEEIQDDEGGGGYYSEDVDGATLAGMIEPALLFEESSFEESGLTTTYDLPGLKTLAPVSTATKHKIGRVEFKAVVFSHIVVPKLRAAAFLKAKLRNTSKITLLKGSAGLTVDGSFLGQSTIPRCSAGDSFTLNLGVDPAVTVGYSRPSVQRSSSGLFTKENCEVFTRVATLTNTKSNSVVAVTLLEQVPISEEERLRIEVQTPKGLRIGGEAVLAGVPKDGDKPRESIGSLAAGKSSAGAARAGVYGTGKDSKWGSAVATAKKGGEINFNVMINPGRGCKLVLEYEATYPGGETVINA
ncbi:hypothetical protein V498_09680 [Pseudogymnoascus sp. VKM F-4517 (FW-2822)]|nr:hypothetical protein V498_09680 [Pseudogymnoascus sp. VKM F-4517 (FW-2822)]